MECCSSASARYDGYDNTWRKYSLTKMIPATVKIKKARMLILGLEKFRFSTLADLPRLFLPFLIALDIVLF
jgi:hypothetical protein